MRQLLKCERVLHSEICVSFLSLGVVACVVLRKLRQKNASRKHHKRTLFSQQWARRSTMVSNCWVVAVVEAAVTVAVTTGEQT